MYGELYSVCILQPLLFIVRYNSGSKAFQAIQSKTLSLSVDAFTIDSQLWQTKRGKSTRKL